MIRPQHRVRPHRPRLTHIEVKHRRRLLCVLRDIHQHRPRPPRARNLKRQPHRRRNLLGARYQEVMFRNRQRDARDVDLLERIRAQHLRAHLPRNRHHRYRVQHRRSQSRHKVCRSRPRRSHTYPHPPRSPRIPIRHMRRALLMPYKHMMDGRKLPQRIIDRQNRPARIPKDYRRVFTSKRGPKDLGSAQYGMCIVS